MFILGTERRVSLALSPVFNYYTGETQHVPVKLLCGVLLILGADIMEQVQTPYGLSVPEIPEGLHIR